MFHNKNDRMDAYIKIIEFSQPWKWVFHTMGMVAIFNIFLGYNIENNI